MVDKIAAHNILAGYNGETILNGLSIGLTAGEFVGVIGPNGSGKTTLLRVMSRTLRPLSGQVTLHDRDIYSIPSREFARRVSVVPQEAMVAFDFSVLEITLMGRSPWLGRFAVEGSRDVGIAMDALSRTGVGHLANRRINALSGGERQRVMVARALAQEPEVMLLDEPTSHLDISFQFEIMDLIRSLNREKGLTVLAVLHDLNLAGQYCDRMVMIGQGSVAASGRPEEVITADNIRRVYGAEVWVRTHPATHRPYVIAGVGARPGVPQEGFDEPVRVHVVGGGGTAAPVLARLARRGYRLTCGVLNAGDADLEVADALEIPCVEQPSFAHITPESHARHLELVANAEVVVLTDVPIGHGNFANLEAVAEAARSGASVVVLRPESIRERDFVEGRAASVVEGIMAAGARSAAGTEELLRQVEDSARRAGEHNEENPIHQ